MNLYRLSEKQWEKIQQSMQVNRVGDFKQYTLGNEKVLIGNTPLIGHVTSVEVDEEREILFVIQKGASFLQEHPEIRVLESFGRYIFIDVSSNEKIQLLEDADAHCWHVEELEQKRLVFEKDELVPKRMTAREVLPSIATRISIENFKEQLTFLASMHDRFAIHDTYKRAALHCKTILEGYGYDVFYQAIDMSNTQYPNEEANNVVALKSGSGTHRKKIIVTAHLDSIHIADRKPDPNKAAPGADDNASGSSGLLELARTFANEVTTHDLILILFGVEELGLHGSKHYVNSLPYSIDDIECVINMDMIAQKNTNNWAVLLEGGEVSRKVIEVTKKLALNHLRLEVRTSFKPYASDHVPFIEKGIPAFLTIEGEDSANNNIHSDKDTLDNIDYELALEILRMNVLAINYFVH